MHMPIQCLPEDVWLQKPKIIHISRDVKDMVVSTYYYLRDFDNLKETFDEFLQDFMDGKVIYTPYREHLLNYVNVPDYPNILYLTYEWVTQNMDEAIRKVVKFLGKEMSTENFNLLREHMKFDTMKSELFVICFMPI